MISTNNNERIAWEDRFNQPTVQQLQQALPSENATALVELRSRLNGLAEVSEQCTWYGDSWGWSLEYFTKDRTNPVAVLIPAPHDLQVAMPLDREFLGTLPRKGQKRAFRDGLELAKEPFDTHWGIWSIQGGMLVDEVVNLVQRKLKYLAKQSS